MASAGYCFTLHGESSKANLQQVVMKSPTGNQPEDSLRRSMARMAGESSSVHDDLKISFCLHLFFSFFLFGFSSFNF